MKIQVVGILCLVVGAIVFVTAPLFDLFSPIRTESDLGNSDVVDSVQIGNSAKTKEETESLEEGESYLSINSGQEYVDLDVELRNGLIGVVLMVLGGGLLGLNARLRNSM